MSTPQAHMPEVDRALPAVFEDEYGAAATKHVWTRDSISSWSTPRFVEEGADGAQPMTYVDLNHPSGSDDARTVES